MTKFIYGILFHIPVLYYSASLTAYKIWDWYLAEPFGIEISQLNALGLLLLIGLATLRYDDGESTFEEFLVKSLTLILSCWILLLIAYIIIILFS